MATLSFKPLHSTPERNQLLDRDNSLRTFNAPLSKPLYRGIAVIDFTQEIVKAELDLEELKKELKR